MYIMLWGVFSSFPADKLKDLDDSYIAKYHARDTGFKKIEDFVKRLQQGYIYFPGGSEDNPLNGNSLIQVMFFDFDETQKNCCDRETLINILKSVDFTPTLICDVKNKKRFRIAYVLEWPITGSNQEAFGVMFEILHVLGVDMNTWHINGCIKDCENITMLSDREYSFPKIKYSHQILTSRIKSIYSAMKNSIIIPLRTGYTNALNVIGDNIDDSEKAYLKYDRTLKDLDLMWFKILFTMHCRGMACAEVQNQRGVYSIPLSRLGVYANRNIYTNQGKRIKTDFDKYNRLIAVTDNKTKMLALKNYIKDGILYYDGSYFNYLRGRLSIHCRKEMWIAKSNKYYMINMEAFKGNAYGEMIAEQLISLSFSFKTPFDRKFTCSEIINMVPVFRDKIETISNAKAVNVYLKRAFETAVHIVNDGLYYPCYSNLWTVHCDIPTSRNMDKIILFEFQPYKNCCNIT